MIMKLFALFHEPKASLMHVENYNCVYLFEKISHSLGRQLLIVIRFNVKMPDFSLSMRRHMNSSIPSSIVFHQPNRAFFPALSSESPALSGHELEIPSGPPK